MHTIDIPLVANICQCIFMLHSQSLTGNQIGKFHRETSKQAQRETDRSQNNIGNRNNASPGTRASKQASRQQTFQMVSQEITED